MAARTALAGSTSVLRFSISGCPEELRVVRFSGQEGLCSLFEFQLELACKNADLVLGELVGQPALLTLEGESTPRYLHGLVSHFEQVEDLPRFTLYRATVVPQAWRLTLRQDCRIFQDLPTPKILRQVLEDAGLTSKDFELRLSNTYEPRNYCVQYRESDWAFLCRLMEEDGIFYFFEHSEDKHLLVMGDGPGACQPIAGEVQVLFRRPSGLVTQAEHVQRFRFSEELRPGQVNLQDFNFKHPDMPGV